MTDSKPYQIRGTQQTLLALRIEDPEAEGFFERLRDDVLRAPAMFKNAPIILDVQALQGAAPVELRKFVARVRACELQPIGLVHGDDAWNAAAKSVGLSVLAAGRPADLQAPEPATPPPPQERAPPERPELPREPAARPGNLLVEQAVRGGQQVYAANGDAICLAAVSNGADVIAAGNVHIYAPLRGRAFAGFDGDAAAMIFCDRLEAQLVSIAGFHLVSDELPPTTIGKRVRIRVATDRLVVEVLS